MFSILRESFFCFSFFLLLLIYSLFPIFVCEVLPNFALHIYAIAVRWSTSRFAVPDNHFYSLAFDCWPQQQHWPRSLRRNAYWLHPSPHRKRVTTTSTLRTILRKFPPDSRCRSDSHPRGCQPASRPCAWSPCLAAAKWFWRNQWAKCSPACGRARTATNCQLLRACGRMSIVVVSIWLLSNVQCTNPAVEKQKWKRN